MASRAERMVKSLEIESKVEFYINILKRTRLFYEKTFSSGKYPEKMVRDTLGFIDVAIGKLLHVRKLLGKYRYTLQPHYLLEAIEEVRKIRYNMGVGAVSSTLTKRVGTIVSELEIEMSKLTG